MTENTMTLTALPAKTGEDDFLRTIAESVLQVLMDESGPWPKAA
jgi:hypothetical protein